MFLNTPNNVGVAYFGHPWVLDDSYVGSGHTLSAGNTQVDNTSGGTNYKVSLPTIQNVSSSDTEMVYFEVECTNGDVEYNGYVCIATQSLLDNISPFENFVFYKSAGRRGNGSIWSGSTTSTSQVVTGLLAFGAGDVVMMAFKPSTRQLWTGVNGTWDNDPDVDAANYTLISGESTYYAALMGRNADDGGRLISKANEFNYTMPTNAVALSTLA